MINKETCEKIWHCHREIDTAVKLLEESEKIIATNKERRHINGKERALKDAFGREQDLQLGIPSGDNSHRLFRVSYDMAVPVIKAHIANKKAQLSELEEIARIELSEPKPSWEMKNQPSQEA